MVRASAKRMEKVTLELRTEGHRALGCGGVPPLTGKSIQFGVELSACGCRNLGGNAERCFVLE